MGKSSAVGAIAPTRQETYLPYPCSYPHVLLPMCLANPILISETHNSLRLDCRSHYNVLLSVNCCKPSINVSTYAVNLLKGIGERILFASL